MSADFGTRTKNYIEDGHVLRGELRPPQTPEEAPMPWTSSNAELNRIWVAKQVKAGIPENKVHELMVEAQIRAFRDVLNFTRGHCWKADFPKNVVLYELFKTYERDTLDALVTKYIVEHGHG